MIRLEQCGWFTTLQDHCRSGWQAYGVSLGGAMDLEAFTLANALVLNEMHTATLEITQAPHRFYTDEDLVVAFTGGGLQPHCNGKKLAMNMPHFIAAGNEIVLQAPTEGFRMYMSVMGGFEAHQIFGSCATDLALQAGGYNGRALRKGDLLRVNLYKSNEQKKLTSMLRANASIEPIHIGANITTDEIAVFPGPEFDSLSDVVKQQLETASFTIGNASNRMGYLLEDNLITAISKKEIISSPVTRGTIQCLPSGNCMLLMADAQTVGGYPRILQTATTSFSALTQKKPGDKIRFRIIDATTACSLQKASLSKLQEIKEGMRAWFTD